MLKDKMLVALRKYDKSALFCAFDTWRTNTVLSSQISANYKEYSIIDLKLDLANMNRTVRVDNRNNYMDTRPRRVYVINETLRNKILSPTANRQLQFDFNRTATSQILQ